MDVLFSKRFKREYKELPQGKERFVFPAVGVAEGESSALVAQYPQVEGCEFTYSVVGVYWWYTKDVWWMFLRLRCLGCLLCLQGL